MIRVGPAGWSYPDWEGVVYPRPKPRGFDALRHLAQAFDVIEINSSFYSIPKVEHVAGWSARVADLPAFRFTAKLHREFTHDARVTAERVREFRAAFEPLVREGRLTAWLAQFPWNFASGAGELGLVERLAGNFREVPLVLELRHVSWFEPASLARVLELGVSLAEIDLPRSKTAPPSKLTRHGGLGYLRLHGRNERAWFDRDATRDQKYDYLYTPAEIESFAERAREIDSTSDDTIVITNNHFTGKAVANAVELAAAITRAKRRVPEPLLATYPRLAGIALPPEQRELFD
ncbi:MAG: DUF72 domain-containing protein [Planctomycetes bacterium]|nr:DUF72 domain-containing protein [Planctomycetota bacterium]